MTRFKAPSEGYIFILTVTVGAWGMEDQTLSCEEVGVAVTDATVDKEKIQWVLMDERYRWSEVPAEVGLQSSFSYTQAQNE